MKVIGVFGISGVGKTTLIQQAIAERPRWSRVSAGSLVQAYRPMLDRDALRKLSAEGLDENQEAIVTGLHQERMALAADVLLFDGHLVLDTDKGLFEITLDVVERLRFDGIVVVEEGARVIEERRTSDRGRSRAVRSWQEIEAEQSRASEIGRSYAQALGVPFVCLSSQQENELVSFVEGL